MHVHCNESIHHLFSVPAPSCNAPVSSNGIITISWCYIHTGGLPLTNVSVVYRFEEGPAMSPPTPVDVVSAEVMRVMVANLVAGRLYTFTITSENSNGSTSIDCGPIHHNTGKYHIVFYMGISIHGCLICMHVAGIELVYIFLITLMVDPLKLLMVFILAL